MRVIFIVHPCNKAIIQRKIQELDGTNLFTQVLIVESESLGLTRMYMKRFARNQGKIFTIKNGKIDNVEEMLVC